jgi:hypothetical protein
MYCHRLLTCVGLLLVLFLNGCQKEPQTSNSGLWKGSGLEFEDYYAMEKVDSLVHKMKINEKCAKIYCYYFGRNKTVASVFSFMDSITICNVIGARGDTIIEFNNNEFKLKKPEAESLKQAIESYKPFYAQSIADQFVDDGYTVIVKNIYNRFNLFSVRAFTNESRKTTQYKFVRHIADLLENHGVENILK